MNTEPLPGWTGQAKQLLDDSAQSLDASTLSRLNRVRQRALEQARPRAMRPWFVPAGLASACAVLIAVAVAWHTPTASVAPASSSASAGTFANDLDMMTSDDGIEFYQDLDFYAWLDAQEKDNNG
ncbi:MAG TPA: hypothetical protein VH082_00220 [Rudaea sp.]|jgi:hypothetical protein|nr:hypothetical protein [Rudaea sp.]